MQDGWDEVGKPAFIGLALAIGIILAVVFVAPPCIWFVKTVGGAWWLYWGQSPL